MSTSPHSTGNPTPGRPTALPPPADLARAVRARLPGFARVDWCAEVDSTNQVLMARARARQAGAPAELLGAHDQHAGRGRGGHAWRSTPGDTLLFSCAFDTALPGVRLPTLGPLMGVASCEALRAHLAAPARARLGLKWPNDLLWDDAKLAGVLVEAARVPRSVPTHWTVVVGLGLNLRGAAALTQALGRPIADWAGVQQAAGGPAPRAPDALVADLATAWQQALAWAGTHGAEEGLPARYAPVDALRGRVLHVGDAHGAGAGIDAQGRLLLHTAQGLQALTASEVSIGALP